MAKKWKKAVITYNGGVSLTVRGHQFKLNRPVTVLNESLAKKLAKKKNFSVQHEYVDVDEPKPATAKPVKKKRTRRSG